MDDEHFDFAVKHISINNGGKRTTVGLHWFFLKPLMRKYGLSVDDVPVWIQKALDADFRTDYEGSLSRQVKRLIVESLDDVSK